MNLRAFLIIIAVVMVISNSVFSQDIFSHLPEYRGKYLGQKIPGLIPVEFAPEIFSDIGAINTIFSPSGDEFYFTTDIDKNNESDICRMKLVDGVWTSPVTVSFNSSYTDNDICMSPDGFRVFWRSWRPLPGHTEKEQRSYIWFAYRTDTGWSKPSLVQTEIGYIKTGYPAISNNGTLYIPYRNADNVGESDIHLSRFVNGLYSSPQSLGNVINTKYIEGDMCVAPDESFLVVSCWDRPDNSGESDLYISFKTSNGSWTKLLNMGSAINNSANENCPTISPDGDYFFFMRYDPEEQKSHTYWVDIGIIEKLKAEYLK